MAWIKRGKSKTGPGTEDQVQTRNTMNIEERLSVIESQIDYLLYESSRMSSLVRFISAPVINDLPFTRQTRSSFDFQWDKLPTGRWNLENSLFREEASGYVCEFTGLPPEWFAGKRVMDVGCGAGRYSWAMSKLGAEVLSIDQSEHGLEKTRKACSEFSRHRVKRVNLLEPLEIEEKFDLVWSFGVLHHTGDTHGAFKKIAPLVKDGGYLFLMIYGEPRKNIKGDFDAVNEYEVWRRKTRNMTFDDRLEAVSDGMEKLLFAANGRDYIEGYFDAISPTINDLYTWEELESWLIMEGFVDIKRTVETRNHHVIARKPD